MMAACPLEGPDRSSLIHKIYFLAASDMNFANQCRYIYYVVNYKMTHALS
jgi:hypothetical protein